MMNNILLIESANSEMFCTGQNVFHALYGLGTVDAIEEKNVLGKVNRYAAITFQSDRLKIMINLDQKNDMVRDLIPKDEVPKVLNFLKECKATLPARSPDRYNINLNKIKSADIYKLVEVIKDLSMLALEKKLTPKELTMLRQTRKMLSMEMSFVAEMPPEEIESMIETYAMSKG